MIRYLIVLLTISASLVAAHPGPNFPLPFGVLAGFVSIGEKRGDSESQCLTRNPFVTVLGALRLRLGFNTGRPVPHDDRSFAFIAILSARAGSLGDQYLDVAIKQLPLLLWLSGYLENSYRDRGRVYAALAFGWWNALPPVAAGF